MASNSSLRFLLVIALAAFAASRLPADVVETKDGARIVGKITKIDAGNVYVDTSYAGSLIVKQKEVVGIETDRPAGVRLESGALMQGVISSRAGVIQVAGTGGPNTTAVAKIAALWPAEGRDPRVVALERHWKFEAELDLNGESGNQNQLGTAAGFRATYGNSVDALQLYTNYNRQVTNNETSADQLKAGVDYASNFEPNESWYVRDETGYDRIMGISLYDIAAVGLGYDLVKNKRDTLTARVGLAYLYDEYIDDVTPMVNSLGADLELNHTLQFTDWKLTNRLAIDPTFEAIKNLGIEQESAYEIPLVAPGWKLRLGVANNYNSKPGEGLQKLDTTYFTRLILSM